MPVPCPPLQGLGSNPGQIARYRGSVPERKSLHRWHFQVSLQLRWTTEGVPVVLSAPPGSSLSVDVCTDAPTMRTIVETRCQAQICHGQLGIGWLMTRPPTVYPFPRWRQ
ncbi:hypothetical protein LIA77_02290 [Sarocladium implicatum]|nr:hypothetical protein LIA77_02290 [Sarocladium implicatum]